MTKVSMSQETAQAVGRAIAVGAARVPGAEVYGPWRGSLEEMQRALAHPDPVELDRLAKLAHEAACRRWAELVAERGRKNIALVAMLAGEDGAVGQLLADGTFAWPGDKVEWVDPVTGAADFVPWIVRESWEGGCLLYRDSDVSTIFGIHHTRMSVPSARMARLRRWLPS